MKFEYSVIKRNRDGKYGKKVKWENCKYGQTAVRVSESQGQLRIPSELRLGLGLFFLNDRNEKIKGSSIPVFNC